MNTNARGISTTQIYTDVIKALYHGRQGTARGLAEELGFYDEATRRILRALEESGMAHVVAWYSPPRGQRSPIYAWGPGENADRTKLRTKEVTRV